MSRTGVVTSASANRRDSADLRGCAHRHGGSQRLLPGSALARSRTDSQPGPRAQRGRRHRTTRWHRQTSRLHLAGRCRMTRRTRHSRQRRVTPDKAPEADPRRRRVSAVEPAVVVRRTIGLPLVQSRERPRPLVSAPAAPRRSVPASTRARESTPHRGCSNPSPSSARGCLPRSCPASLGVLVQERPCAARVPGANRELCA